MIDWLLAAVAFIPSWLRVIVLSAIPVVEFRLAIPVAVLEYQLAPLLAILLACTGGFLVFLPLYFGLTKLRAFCVRFFPKLVRPIDILLERGRRKLHGHYADYGMIGLAVFVAIPLPLTGVWTATLGAVALQIPFKQAAIGILSGLLIGSVVVTIITIGAGSLI